jgi:hypothetical protein
VLLGYRRADVDAALDAADEQQRVASDELASHATKLDEVERVANRLAERVVERERELKEVRAELAEATRKSALSMEALEALVKELERTGRKPPKEPAAGGGAAAEPAETESGAEAETHTAPPEAGESEPAPTRRFDPAPVTEPDSDPVPAASNGHSTDAAARLFEGCVEVEIGPLGDFSQLVGFEDAAREIDATSEISILRFSDGRATLEMTLNEPVELLSELERRCAMEFRVRDNRDGRIILDVD